MLRHYQLILALILYSGFVSVEIKMSGSGFGQDDGFYSSGYYDNQNQNQDMSYTQGGYAQDPQ